MGLVNHQSAGWGFLCAEAVAAGLVQCCRNHDHAGARLIFHLEVVWKVCSTSSLERRA